MFGFSIDLPVRKEWKNVDLLRTSVQTCFSAVFQDLNGCDALSMITGELLENAMKYGSWDDTTYTVFRLKIEGTTETATVTVQNPIVVDSDDVKKLFATVEWIASFDQPIEAYRARLREIAGRDGSNTDSQLGLVRVAYEGGASLKATLEGDSVIVSAQLDL